MARFLECLAASSLPSAAFPKTMKMEPTRRPLFCLRKMRVACPAAVAASMMAARSVLSVTGIFFPSWTVMK